MEHPARHQPFRQAKGAVTRECPDFEDPGWPDHPAEQPEQLALNMPAQHMGLGVRAAGKISNLCQQSIFLTCKKIRIPARLFINNFQFPGICTKLIYTIEIPAQAENH
jgi:hypothetical protein